MTEDGAQHRYPLKLLLGTWQKVVCEMMQMPHRPLMRAFETTGAFPLVRSNIERLCLPESAYADRSPSGGNASDNERGTDGAGSGDENANPLTAKAQLAAGGSLSAMASAAAAAVHQVAADSA